MAHKGQHYLVPGQFSNIVSYNLSWLHTHQFPCWSLNVPNRSCLRVFAFTFLSLEHSFLSLILFSVQVLPFQRSIPLGCLSTNSIAPLYPALLFLGCYRLYRWLESNKLGELLMESKRGQSKSWQRKQLKNAF